MDSYYHNTTSIVTGASSGIGKAFALGLARRGSDVYALSRSKALLHALRREASDRGYIGIIMPYEIDVRNLNEIIRFYKKLPHMCTFLFNNAGIAYQETVEATPDRTIEDLIATNIAACVYMTKYFLRAKSKQNVKKTVVFTSSLVGKIAFPEFPIYSMTKWAIEGLSEALAPAGVRAVTVIPGVVRTNIFAAAKMERYEKDHKASMSAPEDVARIVLDRLPKANDQIVVTKRDRLFLLVQNHLSRVKARMLLDLF